MECSQVQLSLSSRQCPVPSCLDKEEFELCINMNMCNIGLVSTHLHSSAPKDTCPLGGYVLAKLENLLPLQLMHMS